MRKLKIELLITVFITQIAYAHQQPTTLVALEVGSEHVAMNLHVPLTELELAFGHDVTQTPEETIAVWGTPLGQYLIDHIHPVTATRQPWAVQVLDMQVLSRRKVVRFRRCSSSSHSSRPPARASGTSFSTTT